MNFNREIMNRRTWQKKKGSCKIIFYIFPFGLYSFLTPPTVSSPLRAYPQGYCRICSLPAWEEELERANWVTFYITVLHRLDGCCTLHALDSLHS